MLTLQCEDCGALFYRLPPSDSCPWCDGDLVHLGVVTEEQLQLNAEYWRGRNGASNDRPQAKVL